MNGTSADLTDKQRAVIADLDERVQQLCAMYDEMREAFVATAQRAYAEHGDSDEVQETALILANGGARFLDALEIAFAEGAVLSRMWEGSLGGWEPSVEEARDPSGASGT